MARQPRYKLSVGFLPDQAALIDGWASERHKAQGDIVRHAVDLLPFAETALVLIRDVSGIGDALLNSSDSNQMRVALRDFRVRARKALLEREAST